MSEHRYDAAVESLRGQTSADGQWHLLRAYAGVGNVLEVKQLGFKLAAERKDTWARLRSEPLVQKLMEKDAELRDWIKREGRDKEAPVDKPKQKPDAGSRSDGTRS
ncbi:MAG: hypothetical protein HY042_00315 [Spirochaetia bacterium]|nr:hypothetical protein [Spirochaetia bacterium]